MKKCNGSRVGTAPETCRVRCVSTRVIGRTHPPYVKAFSTLIVTDSSFATGSLAGFWSSVTLSTRAASTNHPNDELRASAGEWGVTDENGSGFVHGEDEIIECISR